MLVLNSFCGHMTERMKVEVDKDSDLVIPGGMTAFANLGCCH
jgi:hypothetical protein